MAKQFNDLLLKKMLITENESHLMRSIWLLNPCYCVSIREKLQAILHSFTSRGKVLIRVALPGYTATKTTVGPAQNRNNAEL